MKTAIILTSLLVLFCSSVFTSTAQEANNSTTVFFKLTDNNKPVPQTALEALKQELDPFGWMEGKVVASSTALTSKEAQDYCLGKKVKSGVKVFSLGIHEIDGNDYPYLYVMERLQNTFLPNLKFELKTYELSPNGYTLRISDDEIGEG